MLVGVAFGLVFLHRALAIVLYFILPTAWAILGESIQRARQAGGLARH